MVQMAEILHLWPDDNTTHHGAQGRAQDVHSNQEILGSDMTKA